ncbi:hypothetical protein ACFY00_27690 [Kitasatospora sp. NPDC001540]|uniref:hypothetical protein n=1 Tax=Kitasatospora sp. NPDC001540 TaxID=3364014 RepID=UPI00368D16B1
MPPQRSRAATAPPRGRRARGRQRGAVVLSVAGLVVGGIGAMAMAVMGGPEGAVAPTGPTDPGHSASIGDAASDEASAHATTASVSPADTHRSSKPSAPASSASPSASTGPTTAPATAPASKPAASPTTTPSAPSPTAPATTGPATPTRSASPSPTCKPVLFWCA